MSTLSERPDPHQRDEEHPRGGEPTVPLDDGPGPDEVVLEDEEELSDPAVRERLLAETVAHALAQDAQYSGPVGDPTGTRTGWKILGALSLLAVAGLLLLAPPRLLTGPPPPELTEADRRRGMEATLLLHALEVEAFRLDSARLPGSLKEVGASASDVRYLRTGNRSYQLTLQAPGIGVVIHDGADPPSTARSLAERWLRHPRLP